MASHSVTCYVTPGKPKALKVLSAFAQGAAGQTLTRLPHSPVPGPAAFYGVPESMVPLWNAVKERGQPWLYIDNSYFEAGRGRLFRATWHALQHSGRGRYPTKRFRDLGLKIRPWRRTGRRILVIGQSEPWYAVHAGCTRSTWYRDTCRQLQAATDRPVLIRDKPSPRSLPAGIGGFLDDIWAVVTHTSSVAHDAILMGIPAFVTPMSAAAVMGNTDLERIEEPVYHDDRLPWAAALTENEWTMGEMRSGVAWKALRNRMDG